VDIYSRPGLVGTSVSIYGYTGVRFIISQHVGKIRVLSYTFSMPELSRFLGISILMYFNDHAPPHFHVKYNEFRASVEISTLSILDGELPPRVHGLAIEWAELHRDELLLNWNTLRESGVYRKIEPLV